jgi:glycosyltransferase involved in cell wall biosynthesis
MVRGGVAAEKITVVDQPLDLARFSSGERAPGAGPLRLCYVGSIDARKGVFYLLRAMRAASSPTKLAIVGNTGARPMRLALEREARGMEVAVGPGDPLPAYAASELFVLPSIEDGFGFVVAEAMSCGLPVVVTDQCGAAEWVASAGAGWVVPAGDAGAIARAIDDAAARRSELPAMGARGRAYVQQRAESERCFRALREFAWRGEVH